MKILFVCNQNQDRSKTAEELFRDRFETKSAGLYNERPVTEKEVSWADKIIVMEPEQIEEIIKRFPKIYKQKALFSLDIPDLYHYNQPSLIAALKSKINDLF